MIAAIATARVKLWDWPVRVMHWAIVILLPGLWWTNETDDMALHQRLGFIVLALLVFRLFWGLAGSSTARFSSFLRGPRAILVYGRNLMGARGETIVGHNPIGGWSAVLLLALLISQVILGLFAQDVDGLESGPLAHLVSYDNADIARYWHGVIFNVLLAFIVLHVAAILFYLLVKRDNLVGPMVFGHRDLPLSIEPPTFVPAWRAAIGAALGAGVAWWVSLGCPL